jgi:predicted nucleotide-binding protein (sugar kinase/HSP70/actin superfamily)
LAADRELRRVAEVLSKVPLSRRPEEVPKVLLFGGINRIFVDKPVRDFFEERGILAKTNDISEFIAFTEFETTVRSGFSHGRMRPEEDYSIRGLASDWVFGPGRKAAFLGLRGWLHCETIEWLEKRWRRAMALSGLLFAPYATFKHLIRRSHDKVSWNGWTEAPMTLARYFSCLEGDGYDGYVNIGAFNCAPANTATAVISALSRLSGVPYAAIEADGTAITPGQVRQLETVAAQCLRAASQSPHAT